MPPSKPSRFGLRKQNITSPATGDIYCRDSNGDEVNIAPGTSGHVLTSNGAGSQPTYQAAGGGSGGHDGRHICEGRITPSSGVPVVESDVENASNLYWTPYKGNRIGLYDGSSDWDLIEFTELTVSLSGLTNSKPHDLFIYNNSGSIASEVVEWTNDTTRATALDDQDGIKVKSGASTRRYVGSFYVASDGNVDFKFEAGVSDLYLHVWNYYNQVTYLASIIDSTDHSYDGSSREYNGGSGTISYVQGLTETYKIFGEIKASQGATGRTARFNGGFDSNSSTSTPTAESQSQDTSVDGATVQMKPRGYMKAEGKHIWYMVQWTNGGSCNFDLVSLVMEINC